MPWAARKSLIGGYTSWSEPPTSNPFCFSMAASVAMAVPQMPMRWTLINLVGSSCVVLGPWPAAPLSLHRPLLDHERGAAACNDAATYAEGQRDRRHRRVPGRKSNQYGTWEFGEEISHHGAGRRVARGLVAPRALADLVEKKHGALWRRKLERRRKRSQQLGHRAAVEPAGRLTAAEALEQRRPQLTDGLATGQRPEERLRVITRRAARQPPREHRPMKCDHFAANGQKRQHGGQIAVSDERLARSARLPGIEQRQHLGAAVPAPNADHARDRRVAPGPQNGGGPHLSRSRQITLAREYGVVVHRLEAETSNLVEATIELIALEGARGSDDGEAVAWLQGPRLHHHRNWVISSAIARCASRPRAARSARPVSGRAATVDTRNRSFARCCRLSASSTRAIGMTPSSTAWISASSVATCFSWSPLQMS